MRTSSPTVYRRPNPQDIYYNGIYDPKPQDVIDAENQAKAQELAAKTVRRRWWWRQSTKRQFINKSSTGLQIRKEDSNMCMEEEVTHQLQHQFLNHLNL